MLVRSNKSRMRGSFFMKANILRNLMIFGIVALPLTLHAGEPTSLGWGATHSGVTDGTINSTQYTCPVGFTCGATPIEGDGFLQVSMTRDADNQGFFHTIVLGGAGQAASEQFSAESFVMTGGSGDGIATRQIINDLTSGAGSSGTLESSSTILTGAFYDPSTENTVEMTQTVSDSTTGVSSGGEFIAAFGFTATHNDVSNGGGNNDLVNNLSLTQAITPSDSSIVDSFAYQDERHTIFDGTGTVVGSADGTSVGKKMAMQTQIDLGTGLSNQNFQYDYMSGTMIPDVSAGVSATTDQATFGDSVVVDWVNDDAIERVLVSQQVDNAGDFGFARLGDLLDKDGAGTADNAESHTLFDLTGNATTLIYDNADPFL